MKRLFFALFVLMCVHNWCFASFYMGSDRLWWKGKLRDVGYRAILSKMPDYESLNTKLENYKSPHGQELYNWCSEWKLKNNKLSLIRIYATTATSDTIEADMNRLFGKHYSPGKIKTEWFTDSLVVKDGEYIVQDNRYSDPIYERDVVLFFQKGKFTREKVYDNSKAYNSVYERDSKSLSLFLYPKINWDIIPDMGDKTYRVILSFSSGAERKPEKFKIQRAADIEVLNQEALRVISLLPEWSVHYKFGKFIPLEWTLPFTFNEELRKKYANKYTPKRWV